MPQFRGRGRRRSLLAVPAIALLLSAAVPVAAEGPVGPSTVRSFRPVTTFVVPGGGVAEIVSATPDGETLIYTNAGAGEIGIVDISDAANPVQTTTFPVGGEPTSVSVVPDGSLALAVVKTSYLEEGEAPIITPGKLLAIALPSGTIVGEREIGNGPDSIATTEVEGQLLAAIAIENEPTVVDDEGNLTDGEEPGDPGDISGPGYVQIVNVNESNIAASQVTDVTFDAAELAALGLFFPDDPQPEFIDIRDGNAAVTLQENNGVAVINLASRNILDIFSTGVVENRAADLDDNDLISFTDTYPSDVSGEPFAGARFPDAVAWSTDASTMYFADEGEFDFTGGRGWSMRSASGGFVKDDGGALERLAVRFGAYPDGRSDAKGIEAEGVEIGVFGDREFLFVGSERGSFIGVYHLVTPTNARFVQLLPTGISPEGLLALPQRNLMLSSDEVTGTITIFEGISTVYQGTYTNPVIRSANVGQPWSAISGLAAAPAGSNQTILYGVPDNALPSSIYSINVPSSGPAILTTKARIRKSGKQAFYDLEGIALDTSIQARGTGGFWLASEGNAAFDDEDYQANLLVQVSANGTVQREIRLPGSVDSATGGLIRNNGFEGVAVSNDGRYLLAAIQREYADDEANGGALYARIARYDLQERRWDFFLYPLDPTTTEDDWVGLSEITALPGGRFAVIERDKQLGGLAAIKKVYTFTLDDVQSHRGLVTASTDLSGKIIAKTELTDILAETTPFEKAEGLTLDPGGSLWLAIDNDGGEFMTKLVNLGYLSTLE